MTTDPTPLLLRISNQELTPLNPDEDIRGGKVFDKQGAEIGEIDDLLIDDKESKVRFLQVAAGGFLGLGETRFLVPVDAITRIEAKAVHVDQTRDHVISGPPYDPALIDSDPNHRDYLTGVYGHFGYEPFWVLGGDHVGPGHGG